MAPPPPSSESITSATNGTRTATTTSKNGEAAQNAPDEASKPATAWSTPGPSTHDFRSDVVTTPTTSMLDSITNTTLRDDVFLEDPTTNNLESYIAELTGHEAALLVLSGTMGNQLAVRTHLATPGLGPPHSLVADTRSHILEWEAGGAAVNVGALTIGVEPKENGRYLTLGDVKSRAVISDDIHACPTRLICLENTISGTVVPVEECEKIGSWADSFNKSSTTPGTSTMARHLDGARLWEAVAAQTTGNPPSMKNLLQRYCAAFDSVSLCFSKGLGAPIGSVLIGSAPFIKRARHFRKMYGGGLRQAGVIAAPARVAVEETFLGGKLKRCHETARAIAGTWESLGGKLERPTETNMVWLDLSGDLPGLKKSDVARGGYIHANEQFAGVAAEEGLRILGGRLVVHYQITEDAVGKLRRVFERVLGVAEGGGTAGAGLAGKRKSKGENAKEEREQQELGKKMKLDVE
ncbi:MAG: hypothetical protein M1831_002789 [Alyxoria varia]|nr:MAG: hypothetical protein M1831_002789 [Alyxoria varia]